MAQVKRALPALEEQIDMDPEAFHDFCTFAFKFCLTVRGLLCNICVDFAPSTLRRSTWTRRLSVDSAAPPSGSA